MVLRTQFGYNPFISCLCPTIVFFTVYHLMSISWFLIGRIGLNFFRIGWINHSSHIFPLSSTVDHHNLNFSSRLQQKSSEGVKSELIFVTFDYSSLKGFKMFHNQKYCLGGAKAKKDVIRTPQPSPPHLVIILM